MIDDGARVLDDGAAFHGLSALAGQIQRQPAIPEQPFAFLFDEITGYEKIAHVGFFVGQTEGADVVEADAAAIEDVEPGTGMGGCACCEDDEGAEEIASETDEEESGEESEESEEDSSEEEEDSQESNKSAKKKSHSSGSAGSGSGSGRDSDDDQKWTEAARRAKKAREA